mgnify:CR=1 FL=1
MEKIIYLLKKLVSINSIYPNEQELGDYLFNFFKNKNYKISKQKVEKNRYNLIVEKGKGKKVIGLYAHLDTVNTTKLNWQSNPFKLKIDGDKAFGLGAFDMKGGMVANILSFLEYNPKNIKIKLFFVVDEENISKGGFKLLKSSSFKNIVCIVSTEPAFKYGNQGIVIGRPGRTVFELLIKTQPIHYALYDEKKDIIYFFNLFINQLKKFNKNINQKKQFLFIKNIETKIAGMSTISELKAEIDSCIIHPEDNQSILNKLNLVLNQINTQFNFSYEIRIKKRATPYLNGYELKKNNKYLKIMIKVVKNVTNKTPIPYFRSSIADENIFGYHKVPVLSVGPIGDNAHAANEWVSLKSILTLKEITINFIKKNDF